MSGIAITFPSSPTEGQTHLAQNGFTYIYDSNKNRWKRGGEFVRSPKVLSYAGVAVTTAGATTGPTGALIYNVPGFVIPSSEVGVDTFKAYRAPESYPDYTEVQVSISSDFSSVAYAATFAGLTHQIPAGELSGNQTYYLRARQFVGSDAASAGVGAISGYSANIVSFATTDTFLDAPTIVSISGSTDFPVYQVGFAGTTLPATVTYTGSGVNELDRVDWRVTGPRIPSSTGDIALAEIGIGTHSSATLANALVLALPFSGATGVGITDDVNNAIRTASGASAGTTKTLTVAGTASTTSISGLALTSHFYPCASFFNGTTDYLTSNSSSDFSMGTGDFTVEGWVYQPGYEATDPGLWTIGGSVLGTNTPGYTNSIGMGAFGASNNISVWNNNSYSNTGVTQKYNVWYHFANVRRSGVQYLYLDGVLVWSVADSTDYTGTYLGLGAAYGSNYAGRWYIQDFKVYSGLAKYTENFTPPLPTYGTISYTTGTTNTGINTTAHYQSTGDVPTAEVSIGSSTAAQVADTLVLAMPMNKTFGFQDINVSIRGLTSGASAGTAKTVGLGTTSTANAPTHPIISATESKWYDGAAYFDGGDYGNIADVSDLQLGANDFTMEAWVYSLADNGGNFVASGTNDGSTVAGTSWLFSLSSARTSRVHVGNTGYSLTHSNVPQNRWVHVAFVRNQTNLRIYYDGIVAGELTGVSGTVNNGTATYTPAIGSGLFANVRYYFNGYIQDLKIYKGFAKYTADFTPPQPICGFSTDISTQTGFTTTTASGELLSSVVGLGSTSTLAFDADTHYSGITSITSSSGITTLPDPYAQNLVLALPLADITGVGNSFTNDRNTQIRSVSLVGAGVTAGTTKTITNVGGVSTVAMGSTGKWYGNTAYFDNVAKYLTIPANSEFELISNNTDDFTLEFWVFSTSSANQVIINNFDFVSQYDGWGVYITSAQKINYLTYGSGNSVQALTSSSSVALNVWNHISICRRSGTLSIFINGILDTSTNTSSWFNTTSNQTLRIGNRQTGSGDTPFLGYLQDLKIYKGVAKYTTNFTPPPPMFGDYTRSTPNKIIFTPASDYVLEAKNTSGIITSSYSATRQWGTKPEGGIYDPYAGNLVLAIPGGAVSAATSTYDVTGQIKFETPTATYVNAGIVTYSNSLGIGTYQNKTVTNTNVSISSTIGKFYGTRSMDFSGTASEKSLSFSPGSDLAFGTGDFAIEAWVYMISRTTGYNQYVFDTTGGTRISLVQGISRGYEKIYFSVGSDNVTTPLQVVKYGQWQHWAATRQGTTLRVFVDGVLQGTGTSSTNATAQTTSYIGNYAGGPTGNYNTNGYINDLRIYKGIAKYTSNFTPPNQIYLT